MPTKLRKQGAPFFKENQKLHSIGTSWVQSDHKTKQNLERYNNIQNIPFQIATHASCSVITGNPPYHKLFFVNLPSSLLENFHIPNLLLSNTNFKQRRYNEWSKKNRSVKGYWMKIIFSEIYLKFTIRDKNWTIQKNIKNYLLGLTYCVLLLFISAIEKFVNY